VHPLRSLYHHYPLLTPMLTISNQHNRSNNHGRQVHMDSHHPSLPTDLRSPSNAVHPHLRLHRRGRTTKCRHVIQSSLFPRSQNLLPRYTTAAFQTWSLDIGQYLVHPLGRRRSTSRTVPIHIRAMTRLGFLAPKVHPGDLLLQSWRHRSFGQEPLRVWA